MRRLILMFTALLLVSAASAYAGGGQKGDGELGIYGGYGWLDDYGVLHPKNGMLYGARLGYFFTPHVSFEASAQRLGTETEFELPGPPNVDVHITSMRLNGLYNFRSGEKLRPFLTVGGGYEKVDVEDIGDNGEFGWNAGAGLRWFVTPHWNWRLEGRYVGAKAGEGVYEEQQGNVEATLGLSWIFGGHDEPEPVAAAPPPTNQPPTVSCASERPEVLPGENVSVHATASDPDGDPLTYEWTTTAGHVIGTDANVTLDLSGATAPTTANVTVKVSDGHGHTTSCMAAVSLKEPVKVAAEAVSCLAGGFPRNLSRLTNVDKACLDDMAQRLQADPRAHAVVIGYADSHERSPEDIGEARAKVVQAYVVGERGVEASRVTVRSAAASKPLGSGTDVAAQASNRRVEVWFVPEGAKDPE